jgi:hypothetical protein
MGADAMRKAFVITTVNVETGHAESEIITSPNHLRARQIMRIAVCQRIRLIADGDEAAALLAIEYFNEHEMASIDHWLVVMKEAVIQEF